MIGSAGRQKVGRPECINRISFTIVLVCRVCHWPAAWRHVRPNYTYTRHKLRSARPHRQKPPYLLYIPSKSLFLGWKNGSEPACLAASSPYVLGGISFCYWAAPPEKEVPSLKCKNDDYNTYAVAFWKLRSLEDLIDLITKLLKY